MATVLLVALTRRRFPRICGRRRRAQNQSIVADGILPNGAFGMVLDDDICDLPMTIPSDGSFIDALFGADSDGGGSSGSE